MSKNRDTIQAITNLVFIGENRENIKPADLVIVLGNNDIVGSIDELSFLRDSNKIDENTVIVFTGKGGIISDSDMPEAIRLLNEAISRGFSENQIITEENATNTRLNFELSKKKIEKVKPIQDYKNIVCIGIDFLLRRAQMSAKACGYPIDKMQFLGTTEQQGRRIEPDSWWKNDVAKKRVLEEIERIAKYTIKGDLEI